MSGRESLPLLTAARLREVLSYEPETGDPEAAHAAYVAAAKRYFGEFGRTA